LGRGRENPLKKSIFHGEARIGKDGHEETLGGHGVHRREVLLSWVRSRRGPKGLGWGRIRQHLAQREKGTNFAERDTFKKGGR